jgi:hypothetical protein
VDTAVETRHAVELRTDPTGRRRPVVIRTPGWANNAAARADNAEKLARVQTGDLVGHQLSGEHHLSVRDCGRRLTKVRDCPGPIPARLICGRREPHTARSRTGPDRSPPRRSVQPALQSSDVHPGTPAGGIAVSARTVRVDLKHSGDWEIARTPIRHNHRCAARRTTGTPRHLGVSRDWWPVDSCVTLLDPAAWMPRCAIRMIVAGFARRAPSPLGS